MWKSTVYCHFKWLFCWINSRSAHLKCILKMAQVKLRRQKHSCAIFSVVVFVHPLTFDFFSAHILTVSNSSISWNYFIIFVVALQNDFKKFYPQIKSFEAKRQVLSTVSLWEPEFNSLGGIRSIVIQLQMVFHLCRF